MSIAVCSLLVLNNSPNLYISFLLFHQWNLPKDASILISKDVDVVKVSKRLGHANAKITLETYAHLVPNEDNYLAEIFEKELEKIS